MIRNIIRNRYTAALIAAGAFFIWHEVWNVGLVILAVSVVVYHDQ